LPNREKHELAFLLRWFKKKQAMIISILLTISFIGLYVYTYHSTFSSERICINYKCVITNGELWRTFTGPFFHTWPHPPPTPLPPGIGPTGGKVDAWLGPALTMALQRLTTAQHGGLKVGLMQVVESCIVYNATMTLQMLEQAGATQQVFTMWMQPGTLGGHVESRSKRLCALAFMCLLRLPSNAVPESVRAGFGQIFTKNIEMLCNLEQQRTEDEEEGCFWDISNENAVEEDDDDDDDTDEDSDDEGEDEAEVIVADDADIVSEEDKAYLESLEQIKQDQEDRRVREEKLLSSFF